MGFENLSITSQQYLLEQHSYMSKWFLFLVFALFSLYYIFIIWKNQELTISFGVAIIRLLLFVFSVGYLVTIPFTFISLSPEASLYDVYALPLSLYQILLFVGLIVFMFDLLYYGIFGLIKYSGLDINAPNVKEFIGKYNNMKHFYKFNKKKGKY